MKDIPIIMATDMVCAILNGRKGKTRRMIDVQPPANAVQIRKSSHILQEHFYAHDHHGEPMGWVQPCKFGQCGDRLYVRETWLHSNWPHGPYDDDCEVFYRADYADDPHGFDGEKSPEGKYRFWLPSIHLPKSRSRLFLHITDVRAERLQDISEEDAVAEGWSRPFDSQRHQSPLEWFRSFWESMYGIGSWDLNPWVWVISFMKEQP